MPDTVTNNGHDDVNVIYFHSDASGTPWSPPVGSSAANITGNGSGVFVGFPDKGDHEPVGTVSVTNADALVFSGLEDWVGVNAGSVLSATGGNAVDMANGSVTLFINSQSFYDFFEDFHPISLEEGWNIFLEGQLNGDSWGTVNGDIHFTDGGIGRVNNFGTLNGAVTASSGGDYQVANSGLIANGIDVTASGDATVHYASMFNNGAIHGGVKLSGPNALMYNLSTGDELVDLLSLVVPDAVDQIAQDDPGIATTTRTFLLSGAPTGSVKGHVDGGVVLDGGGTRLMNMGTIEGTVHLIAATVAQVNTWANGGLRGFNQLWNSFGATITGDVTFAGGSTLEQAGLLFRSSMVNLGEIIGDVKILGGSTTVINGANVAELTSGFFSAGGAPAEEEIALLRAAIPAGVDRGVMTGDITFSDSGHSFLNLGLVNGTVTFGSGADIFSNVGEVTGNVDLGGGNDTAFVGASSILDGTLSGGAGLSNALTIFGTGTFDPAKFLNFQTIVFDVQTGSSATLTPTGAIEGNFTVAPGVTLDLTQGGTLASTTDDRDIGIAGPINGDVDLGSGANTTFTLNQGGSVTGAINGGTSGTSTLNLNVSGTVGNDISAFKTVKVSSADPATPLKLTGNVIVLDTTSLIGGALRVNGSLTSPNVNVDSNSVLGGSGTVTGSVSGDGTVAPGNSIGTLSISGNYANAGTLEIEVSPEKNLDTFRADKLIVSGAGTGNIDLTGSHLFVTAETPHDGPHAGIKEVTTANDWPGKATVSIIDFSGARTGTFTTVTDDFIFLTPSVDYDDANGEVLLTLSITPVDTSLAQNGNELSMLNALNDNLGTLGSLWGVGANEIATLTGEQGTSGSTLANSISNQVMGFIGRQPGSTPGTYVISMDDNYNRIKVASVDDNVDLSAMHASSSARIWVAPWGNRTEYDGSSGISGYDSNSYGLVGGYIANPSDNIEIGVSGGYGHAKADGFSTGGDVELDSLYLAAHGARIDGPLTLQGTIAYGHQMFDQQRVAVVGGTSEVISASYSANELIGQIRASYALSSGKFGLVPYIGTDYALLFRPSFTETGSTLGANLMFDSETYRHGNLFYGVDLASAASLSQGGFRPYLGIGANYAYGDLDGQSNVRFAGTGTAFLINGAAEDRWQMTTRAGFSFLLVPNIDIGFGYRGAYGRDQKSHTIQASLTYNF